MINVTDLGKTSWMQERLAAGFGTQQVPSCPGGQLYTVRSGDTLFRIAQRFNVSLDALIRANPQITNPDRLQVGQRICIPGVAPPTCQGGTLYTIRQGDTFFRLAQRFGVTVDQLIAANPGVDPDRLQIGQQICIPGVAPPTCQGGTLYTIRQGDTFFRLAQRFGVTVDQLIAANPGVDPDRLQIGQQICIPGVAPPGCEGGFLYTIRAGDTFFSLAQRFGVTVDELIDANPGVDPDALRIGQEICIPTEPPGPECPGGTLYTIRSGDTLFSLANRFNTTVDAILEANPLITDPDNLRVGQIICIPGASS
ncbi:MAG: LysM peptidoglycan-binding domain-containing protein [Bacillota bacterium]